MLLGGRTYSEIKRRCLPLLKHPIARHEKSKIHPSTISSSRAMQRITDLDVNK